MTLNPLAILISKARVSYIEKTKLLTQKEILLENINKVIDIKQIYITNVDFWIEKQAQSDLNRIFYNINNINDYNIKNLFLLAFSETLKGGKLSRNNEFKLFRMKNHENYKPNTHKVFQHKLDSITNNYLCFYQPKLQNISYDIIHSSFKPIDKKFDIILTSPPYGDSKTTVAYGQFSAFINEYLGFKDARKLDSKLLGGIKSKNLYNKGIVRLVRL